MKQQKHKMGGNQIYALWKIVGQKKVPKPVSKNGFVKGIPVFDKKYCGEIKPEILLITQKVHGTWKSNGPCLDINGSVL